MTKEEIIKYVMTTPENTNPAILMQMLDQLLESPQSDNLVGSAIVGSAHVGGEQENNQPSGPPLDPGVDPNIGAEESN